MSGGAHDFLLPLFIALQGFPGFLKEIIDVSVKTGFWQRDYIMFGDMTASLKELYSKGLPIGRIDGGGISQWIGDIFYVPS